MFIGGCLPCAWHLRRPPTGSVWRFTALMDAPVLVLNAQLLGESGHQHVNHAAGPNALMWLCLGLVGAQLALAGAAALRRS